MHYNVPCSPTAQLRSQVSPRPIAHGWPLTAPLTASRQVIEFESTAMVIGALGIRVQLVAYPVVSIRKVRHMCRMGVRVCRHRCLARAAA